MQGKTSNLIVLAAFLLFLAASSIALILFCSKSFLAKNGAAVVSRRITEDEHTQVSGTSDVPQAAGHRKSRVFASNVILFVGDIMFDRGVEYLLNKNNVFYPFEKIEPFLKEAEFIVGNLEGPVLANPPYFPDESLKFAFSAAILPALSQANFNLLSLANNHTLNAGESGLNETKELLSKAEISFVGHPVNCEQDYSFDKEGILFLSFNRTFSFNCSASEIAYLVKQKRELSPEKFLVVVMHWGEEYQSKSNLLQQETGHQLIEAGADLIIGSHPHVVQEVEEYQNKLIFYSLGNFIFDQYFSQATQQGLAVALDISSQGIVYQLFPVESRLSQPFLMEAPQSEKFLDELAQKSSPQLSSQIKDGIIRLNR